MKYLREHISDIAVVVFTLILSYQTFHWIEHMVQVYQHGVLHIVTLHAHGILFRLDLEWNHFAFNSLYFFGLLFVFLGEKMYTRTFRTLKPWVAYPFMIALFVESWHLVEHTVRIVQHVQTGCEPCTGIGGMYFDLIFLHGGYNMMTFTFPLIAYIAGKYYLRLWKLL